MISRVREAVGGRGVPIIVGVGLAGWFLRIAAVLWYRPTCTTGAADCYTLAGDAYYHHHQADLIHRGHWFINPHEYIVNGHILDSAGDPPLYALYLAFWSRLGLDGVTDHRLVSTLAGFALIGNIAGQSMMTYAFAHLPASFGAVSLLVVPVFAALFAWLLFGETVSAAQAIAGAAVLGGIVLAERGRRRPRDGPRGSRR